MPLHYTPGVAEYLVSARSSSLYLSTTHVLHDFVDSAISDGARLAASSPADERKTLSVTLFFYIYFVFDIRRYNSCKNYSTCMLTMAAKVERK